ncbi:hypothetical protein GALL_135640 [mine drainage metagenome]|uniref:Lipoprotein n=1 Tax=mine drainage metagenome TaxID=410659 RepID=A0A1J5SRV4_9ZZZZ
MKTTCAHPRFNLPWFTILGLSALLLGCRSQNQSRTPALSVRPATVLLTPEQAAEKGLSVAPEEAASRMAYAGRTASVLVPADVKAYSIGRYVDPADPSVMHEAHVVYRREADSGWRLEADAGRQILVGPSVSSKGGDRIVPQETEAVLTELRRSAASDREAVRMLAEMVERLARNQNDVAERLAALDSRMPVPRRTGSPVKTRVMARPEAPAPASGENRRLEPAARINEK